MPIILVHEADEGKGGAPLDVLKKECEEHCTAGTVGELFGCEHVTEKDSKLGSTNTPNANYREVITWVRSQEFQLVAIKCVCRCAVRDVNPS